MISSHVTFPEAQESQLYKSLPPALFCGAAHQSVCYSLIRHLIEFLLSDCTHSAILFCCTKKKPNPKPRSILRFICPVINHLLTVMIIAVPQTKDCALRFVWNESSEE